VLPLCTARPFRRDTSENGRPADGAAITRATCGVLVENLNQDGIRGGLNERNLQRDAEAKLRGLGITVLAPAATADKPYIYVNVLVSKISGAGYIFAVSLALHEYVRPERDKTLSLSATTWERTTQSGADQNSLPPKVARGLSLLFEEFRKDYELVNAQ
jgi:hypothetical protein